MTREELEAIVSNCTKALAEARQNLDNWNTAIEHNVYNSIGGAAILAETLADKAREDCEGSYNCGESIYTQDFLVGSTPYRAVLECEYDRHDKTYYYLDEYSFHIYTLVDGQQGERVYL